LKKEIQFNDNFFRAALFTVIETTDILLFLEIVVTAVLGMFV